MKVYSCFFLFTATDDSSNVKCYPSAIPRPLKIVSIAASYHSLEGSC
jgi:hypothetical protein